MDLMDATWAGHVILRIHDYNALFGLESRRKKSDIFYSGFYKHRPNASVVSNCKREALERFV